MTLILLLAQWTAAAGPCQAATSSLDLADRMQAAEHAFSSMDIDGFTRARDDAGAVLTCLGEVVNPVDAAAYHRMQALDAFLAEDEARAVGAFAAARHLQPDGTLSESLAPLGNPLRAAWDAAGLLPETPGEALPRRADVVLYLDGSRAENRPAARATIIQATSPTGRVEATAWLRPADPLPGWTSIQVVSEKAPARVRSDRERSPATRPLIIAAGASALVAGGLYGGAWVPRGKFLDDATALGDLDGYRVRTNALTVGAGVAGGIALGAGVGAVLTVAF